MMTRTIEQNKTALRWALLALWLVVAAVGGYALGCFPAALTCAAFALVPAAWVSMLFGYGMFR